MGDDQRAVLSGGSLAPEGQGAGIAARGMVAGAFAINAGLAVVLAVILILLIVSQQTDGADFTAFATGWRVVLDGRGAALYDPVVQAEVQRALLGGRMFPAGLAPFINPPHLVLPFVPLGLLPLRPGYVAWVLVQGLLLSGIVMWLLRRVAREWSGPERAVLVAWAIAFPSVAVSFFEGSFALVMVLALLGAYLETEGGRHLRAGAWLALATLKPQTAVGPALSFLIGRRLRVIAATAGIIVALAVVATATLGPGIWGGYAALLGEYTGTFDQYSVTPSVMWNVRGTLALLLGRDAGDLVNNVSWAVFAAGMVAIGWLWRRGWPTDRRAAALSYSITIAITLLVTPHLNPHDDALLLVAVPVAYGALRGSALGTSLGIAAALAPILITLVNGVGVTPETSLPVRLPTVLLALFVAALIAGLRVTRGQDLADDDRPAADAGQP